MIREQKKWMCYTYFNRAPAFAWTRTHLFSPVQKNIPGMIRRPSPTIVADIIECDFLSSWSPSCRTKVRKAESEGVRLQRGNELLPEILDLFKETARSKKLRGHYPEDFHSRPWILCSAVYLEDKILAGHIWVLDEEEKRSLLYVNASRHLDPSLDANLIGRAHYYLLWQDGMYLRNNGFDCLDLHGYDPSSKDPALTGVYRWKEATHGRQEELYHYYPFWFFWFHSLRKKIRG